MALAGLHLLGLQLRCANVKSTLLELYSILKIDDFLLSLKIIHLPWCIRNTKNKMYGLPLSIDINLLTIIITRPAYRIPFDPFHIVRTAKLGNLVG